MHQTVEDLTHRLTRGPVEPLAPWELLGLSVAGGAILAGNPDVHPALKDLLDSVPITLEPTGHDGS